MQSATKMESELSDWREVCRAILRQIAAGRRVTETMVRAHKNACDHITDLELKLKRARKRKQ